MKHKLVVAVVAVLPMASLAVIFWRSLQPHGVDLLEARAANRVTALAAALVSAHERCGSFPQTLPELRSGCYREHVPENLAPLFVSESPVLDGYRWEYRRKTEPGTPAASGFELTATPVASQEHRASFLADNTRRVMFRKDDAIWRAL